MENKTSLDDKLKNVFVKEETREFKYMVAKEKVKYYLEAIPRYINEKIGNFISRVFLGWMQ